MVFAARARLLVSLVLAAFIGPATANEVPSAVSRCASLAGRGGLRLRIFSATEVPAGTYLTGSGQSWRVPASCRVAGEARPTDDARIGFQLWMPKPWNGRYVQLGNGGFAGNIDEISLANEIRRGNAAAMTDTGHRGSQFDASWALGHPERLIDYGYRSIKVTADAAKLLLGQFYTRSATRRYYVGCSNGGRQALMAAQRYPDDWDGIIAGSPALDWTRQFASLAAIQHQLRAAPENWIPASKFPLVRRRAAADCPGAPTSLCRIDVEKLRCRGANGPNCLTELEAQSLEMIQSGPRDARGEPLFSGYSTSGAYSGNWDRWILNPDPGASSDLTFATQAYRYFVLDDARWEVGRFDQSRDFSRASNRRIGGRTLSSILDANDPQLDRFARHGGKIIVYVGTADAIISPAAALAYYRDVVRRAGGITRARPFIRLFVVPGMEHCQGGNEPNAFGQAWVAPAAASDPTHDIRLALQNWTEKGRSPDSLVAVQYSASGSVTVGSRVLKPLGDAYPVTVRATNAKRNKSAQAFERRADARGLERRTR
jgi:feruloyl esterase